MNGAATKSPTRSTAATVSCLLRRHPQLSGTCSRRLVQGLRPPPLTKPPLPVRGTFDPPLGDLQVLPERERGRQKKDCRQFPKLDTERNTYVGRVDMSSFQGEHAESRRHSVCRPLSSHLSAMSWKGATPASRSTSDAMEATKTSSSAASALR